MLTELRNLPAPAKLNLFLHVTGRRDDGYHLLETVFQLLDLADSVDLVLRRDGVIRRLEAPAGIPEELDLSLKAARALQAATGCRYGADIGLRKQIPIGAGLGGGSSDAATVLLGLNQLWELELDRDFLMEVARPLGADVPFFLYGRNAYATGIGDRFEPIELPPRWFVLLMPPVSIPTVSVFSAPELTRNTEPITIAGFSRTLVYSASKEGPNSLGGRNDLEPVVLARHPAVSMARETLVLAASPESVRMTGSGACIFAACDSREAAAAVVDRLGSSGSRSGHEDVEVVQWSRQIHLVSGLAEHPLGSRQVG